jgi:hypothetical protein
MRTCTTVAFCCILAASAVAQTPTLTMGNTVTTGNSGTMPGTGAHTVVDLAHPANATGSLTKVEFEWSARPCGRAVKVKVFRRVGDSFSLVAERGPFSVDATPMTVNLSPAIAVQQGDLLGVSRVVDCGNLSANSPGWESFYVAVAGDATSFSLSGATEINQRLNLRGTGTATEVIAGVIPAVASNPGAAAGSYYKTLVQAMALPNLSSVVTGRFVFRKKGKPGSPSDPSMAFSITAGAVKSWPDIQTAMGQTGSPGSIDVVIPWGGTIPRITAQVYNDAGSAGTTGFRQDLVHVQDTDYESGALVFFPGATGFVLGPADAVRYRCNIGIRSLAAGFVGVIHVRRANGERVGTKHLTFAPNTYDQQSWAALTGVALANGMYLEISVSRGSAMFYVSHVDNTTQDPANSMARTAYAVL